MIDERGHREIIIAELALAERSGIDGDDRRVSHRMRLAQAESRGAGPASRSWPT